MNNFRSKFLFKRRWLALASLIWSIMVYVAWILYNSPASGLGDVNVQCNSSDAQFYPYAYAVCLQMTAQAASEQQAKVATAATLIAILPVMTIWAFWFVVGFARQCSVIDASSDVD